MGRMGKVHKGLAALTAFSVQRQARFQLFVCVSGGMLHPKQTEAQMDARKLNVSCMTNGAVRWYNKAWPVSLYTLTTCSEARGNWS
ncbi:hypothetical protein HYQ46_010182 [Verticillium longisporum]|nr:hypothetical protein HYQ46_010182 [Verticillium longisporum]